jgi:hypothetical protein
MIAVGAAGVIVWKLVHPKENNSPLEDDLLYWFDFAEANFGIIITELQDLGDDSNFSVTCPPSFQFVGLQFDKTRQKFIVSITGGTYSAFYCRVICKQLGQLNALADKFNESLPKSKKY